MHSEAPMGGLASNFVAENAKLAAHLHEKELELQRTKEKYDKLCRRFRDSLGTVSMLFAAQARRTAQPELCRKCISCLIGVYDLQDISEESVCMGTYLPNLSRVLITSFDDRIRLATSIDPAINLDFRKAHCIGLIYAEAASNALKHAFSGLSSGVVYATLRIEEGGLELVVTDSGYGFDVEQAMREGAEGLNFMRDLARQIDGCLQITSSQAGTTVSLTCPLERIIAAD
jgi:two-component sensor histidine kinase